MVSIFAKASAFFVFRLPTPSLARQQQTSLDSFFEQIQETVYTNSAVNFAISSSTFMFPVMG
jgi:hypothetical protein